MVNKCEYDDEVTCNKVAGARIWQVCVPCRLAAIAKQLKCLNFSTLEQVCDKLQAIGVKLDNISSFGVSTSEEE